MKRTLLIASACLVLSSCAVVTKIPLKVAGHDCEAFEVRPSWFSVVPGMVCNDKDGKPIGMIGGQGTTQAEVAARAVEGAAVLSAAGIVASQLKRGTDVRILAPR